MFDSIGQYHAFQLVLHKFFKSLFTYNIKICGIVLDWLSVDEAFQSRSIRRILAHHLGACEIIHNLEKTDYVSTTLNEEVPLPFLTLITFINFLKKMNLNLWIAKGFGDPTIVAIAEKEKAYILAHDSDFMIYPLTKGYLCLDRFNLKEGKVYLFKSSYLVNVFRLHPRLLPLYAVSMGTAYMAPEEMEELFMNLPYKSTTQFSKLILERLKPYNKLSLKDAMLQFVTELLSPGSDTKLICETKKFKKWVTKIQRVLEIYMFKPTYAHDVSQDPNDPYGFLMKIYSNQFFYGFSLWEDYSKPSAWHLSRPLRVLSYIKCKSSKPIIERIRTLVKGEFSDIKIKVPTTVLATCPYQLLLNETKHEIVFALKFLKYHQQLSMTQLLAVALATYLPTPCLDMTKMTLHPNLYHFVALFETTLVSWSMASSQPLTRIIDGASIFYFFHVLLKCPEKNIWLIMNTVEQNQKCLIMKLIESVLGFDLDMRSLASDGIYWKVSKLKPPKKLTLSNTKDDSEDYYSENELEWFEA